MNLPNKLTVFRVILVIIMLIISYIPMNNSFLNISLNMWILNIIFIVASITDSLDGKIARKNNLVTDTGKILDAIADKVLVNSVLVIFASNGFIHPIIAVIYIFRDEVVNALRIHAAKNGIVVPAGTNGKIKTFAMMVGLSLMFFYNLPFELINIRLDIFLVYLCLNLHWL